MKSKNIEFIRIMEYISEDYNPVPASKSLPDWYKDMAGYITYEKMPLEQGNTPATIKKCMPVFDSLSAGYLIRTYCDISIVWDGTAYDFILPQSYPRVITSHSLDQLPNHPGLNEEYTFAPKWTNAWSIKTPKGYSSLIIPPMHRDNIISIMPGVVDTDSFEDAVNFPFLLNRKEFTGIIPAGTPIAQVIPFKRESWESKTYKKLDHSENHARLVRSVFFEGYKNMFWKKKSYK
jgi:hypothetical protein